MGAAAGGATEAHETSCNDHQDNDHDGLTDCADGDCFGSQYCLAGGQPESNNETCSDFIDNDGDGVIDCDDPDCQRPGITVCQGSYGQHEAEQAAHRTGVAQNTVAASNDTLPRLTGTMTVDDLIGHYGDNDGENNDYTCSDGIDNDHDGRIDCQDIGCRFDPNVHVCTGNPALRFSIVGGVAANWTQSLNADGNNATPGNTPFDVRFTRLQIRAFGPIPFLDNSFFLVNTRLEKSPRLTFVNFQVPVGNNGDFVSLNSGSGGLSSGLIISTSKEPLLDPPYYLYNAFEQGNGAAVEFGAPLLNGFLHFRVFAAGGTGLFNGNVGGRYFKNDLRNFAYNAGAQLQINFAGYYNRFDSTYLYTPVPLTVALMVGGKYDQRPTERYPAANLFFIFRYSRFLFRIEDYGKYGLDYGGYFQNAWNAQTSILIVPKMLMLAADVGTFNSQTINVPGGFGSSTLTRPLDELDWRVALHFYYYRNIGLLSLLYSEQRLEQNPDSPSDPTLNRELRLEAQFRF